MELKEKIVPVAAEIERLETQIKQQQTHIEGLLNRATELQAERTTKQKKLQEMSSKVKSKNEQVSIFNLRNPYFVFGLTLFFFVKYSFLRLLHSTSLLAGRSEEEFK